MFIQGIQYVAHRNFFNKLKRYEQALQKYIPSMEIFVYEDFDLANPHKKYLTTDLIMDGRVIGSKVNVTLENIVSFYKSMIARVSAIFKVNEA